jgi:hypothetical protein
MDDDGFANHINRRSDLFNGMPRAGDSGAAVFWPPLSNPRPPHHLRLVGVHSGRRATAEGEVAAYIPIDPASEEWIRRIDAQAAAAATTRPKKPPSNVSPTKCHFRHRATLPCWHFPDPPAEIAGVDLDLSTKGKNELLAHASKLKLEVAGQQLRMLLTQPKLGPVSVMLHRDTIGPGGHWYTNDDGTNDCYYLFLVDSRAKPQKPDDRRSPVIHIEAFKAGSCQPRPSSCTIWDDTGTKRLYCQQDEPEPWDAKPCRSDDATFFQDQDDEGNGHDPP